MRCSMRICGKMQKADKLIPYTPYPESKHNMTHRFYRPISNKLRPEQNTEHERNDSAKLLNPEIPCAKTQVFRNFLVPQRFSEIFAEISNTHMSVPRRTIAAKQTRTSTQRQQARDLVSLRRVRELSRQQVPFDTTLERFRPPKVGLRENRCRRRIRISGTDRLLHLWEILDRLECGSDKVSA